MCVNDRERIFLLLLTVPPEFIWYSPMEASLSYPEGSSLNFSCRAFAIPSVNITWIYRDQHKQTKSTISSTRTSIFDTELI